MIKIFLVEDEFIIREGIKNNIDWAAHGYEFCGEAGDGELAYPMIQKLRPNIVITDIRMPFMDGLELSRLLKKEMPETEIIIISGYEEFDYAKEAIQIGVAQYLLKPINGEELVKEIDAIAAKMEEKRREREIREQYIREMKENYRNERKSLFQHMVAGTKTMPELLEIAEKLEMDISALWYNVMLFDVYSGSKAHDAYSGSLIELEQKLQEKEEEQVLVFDRGLEGKAFVFKADSVEALKQLQEEYIRMLKGLIEPYKHVRYFGGIGAPVNRLRELPASFETASHAFAHRYLLEGSCVLDGEEMEQGVYIGSSEEFDIGNVDTKQIDRNKIKEFLKMGETEETVYFVDEFFKALGSGAMKSLVFRQYITMDSYFCVVDFVEGLHLQKDEIEQPNVTAGILQDEDGSKEYVVRIIKQALALREKAAGNRYADIVNEIMHYIEENYAQEELSLNLLAAHVNFSPNHLSTVFSQQTGHALIKYLTDFRMNKAKELLRCTSKRSSVISEEVGYKDPHYFSYLFKKTQGMTPTQYRGGKSGEGEE